VNSQVFIRSGLFIVAGGRLAKLANFGISGADFCEEKCILNAAEGGSFG
jgi:hypothetical protein